MSPSVELSPDTFKRLQAHAVPLVDTIETVIQRVLDAFEQDKTAAPADAGDGQAIRTFNPNSPPDLTHAKLLGVSFDGQKLGRGRDNWNGLLHHAVKAAKSKAKSDEDFAKLMVVNHVKGDKHDEGYRPVSDTGMSVQGQDANGAWRAACHIVQTLGCPLSVKFAWREKEGAAFPGLTGQMVVAGK
jgi:hypothetical protein